MIRNEFTNNSLLEMLSGMNFLITFSSSRLGILSEIGAYFTLNNNTFYLR